MEAAVPTDPSARQHPFDKYVWDDIVMVLLALASLGILGYLVYADQEPDLRDRLLYVDLGIVAVFWLDYAARMYYANDRKTQFRRTWYELLGMVPIFPGMTEWGPLRLFRLLRVLRIVRLLGAARNFDGFERRFQRYVKQSKLGYVAALAAAIIFVAAGVAWLVEPDTFATYGDALWWAIVTATTVGYGDYYPTTGWGRAVGVLLMLLGVGIIGTFAGLFSGFLVDRRFEEKRAEDVARDEAGDVLVRTPNPLPAPGFDLARELERLASLRERQLITQDEYERAKRKLLE
jgi:voltage-gated potassium channel